MPHSSITHRTFHTPHAEPSVPQSYITQYRTSRLILGVVLALLTYGLAFWLRMLEWPSWQSVEFKLGNEMLLATHDAYHWVAGAAGFSFGAGHPMSELLRVLANTLGSEPAHVAFWLPPVMASGVAVLVFMWAWSMGSMEAGVCAGILASLTPGFLARTLLGYSDTDLVTLFLPLVTGLMPAMWVSRFARHPLALVYFCIKRPLPTAFDAPRHAPQDLVSPLWAITASLSGLLGWWATQWHSLFPYLSCFNAVLFAGMALCLTINAFERRAGILAAACYALPLFLGLPGLALGAITALVRPAPQASMALGIRSRLSALLLHPALLCLFGGTVLWTLVDNDIVGMVFRHVQGYVKSSGDASAFGGSDPLVFPSVAQSILEIQDLSLVEMLLYFHTWPAVAVMGLAGFCLLLFARSGALFLLPMLALAFLSTKMGGRMIMFGAPVVALGLVLPIDWLLCALGDVRARRIRYMALIIALLGALITLVKPEIWGNVLTFWLELHVLLQYGLAGCAAMYVFLALGRIRGWRVTRALDAIGPHLLSRVAGAGFVLLLFVPPLASLIPDMTHGPILNRRHADALKAIGKATPEDAMLWLWWDWGYATHHFAHRTTIADGAAHGGPSLYLPAAVFTTDSPRFARQLIKYTALSGNVPGNVFKDMGAAQADALIKKLASPEFPLLNPTGKQYVVVSFDMLNLGFWISTFGNWDFLKKEGRGYAISIVPQQLSYNLSLGKVQVQGGASIPASSLDIFEDGRLVHRDYVSMPQSFSSAKEEKAWLADMEQRRNIHFLFNRVTGEKLVVDDNLYNTLMIRLLISPPNAPDLRPYFKLIYDNVFCRVYEVL